MQARFADLRTEAPPASEQQAEIDAQRGALEADVAALKQEYARLQRERSQLQGDVQVTVSFVGFLVWPVTVWVSFFLCPVCSILCL